MNPPDADAAFTAMRLLVNGQAREYSHPAKRLADVLRDDFG
jgi:hypothetical protein